MRHDPRTPELIDDEPMLFDTPPEWLVSDHRANDWRHEQHDGGLRSLASNVSLLSRREWPRPRRRRRLARGTDGPDFRRSA